MAFEVGRDIEGMCRTCGDVWHVIVAKVGDKVSKVQCKQCGGSHRLKPTGDAPQANLEPTRRRVVSAGGKKTRARSTPGRSGGLPDGPRVFDPNLPSRAYGIRETFTLGEQIKHKTFGNGVVIALEENKVRVEFPLGVKVLLHGRR